jgi:hypothetical protein
MMIAFNLLWKYKNIALIALIFLLIGFMYLKYDNAINTAERLAGENSTLKQTIELQKKGMEAREKIEKDIRTLDDDDFAKRRARWLRD